MHHTIPIARPLRNDADVGRSCRHRGKYFRPLHRLHVSPRAINSQVKRYNPKSPRVVVENPRMETPMPNCAVRVRRGRCFGRAVVQALVAHSRSRPVPCAANRNEIGIKSRGSRDGSAAAVPRMTTRRAVRNVEAADASSSFVRTISCGTVRSAISGMVHCSELTYPPDERTRMAL